VAVGVGVGLEVPVVVPFALPTPPEGTVDAVTTGPPVVGVMRGPVPRVVGTLTPGEDPGLIRIGGAVVTTTGPTVVDGRGAVVEVARGTVVVGRVVVDRLVVVGAAAWASAGSSTAPAPCGVRLMNRQARLATVSAATGHRRRGALRRSPTPAPLADLARTRETLLVIAAGIPGGHHGAGCIFMTMRHRVVGPRIVLLGPIDRGEP